MGKKSLQVSQSLILASFAIATDAKHYPPAC